MTNQREHDLVRQMRGELFAENLITKEEYAALASEHGGVQRLEDYDRLRAEIAEAKEDLAHCESAGEDAQREIERLTAALTTAERARDEAAAAAYILAAKKQAAQAEGAAMREALTIASAVGYEDSGWQAKADAALSSNAGREMLAELTELRALREKNLEETERDLLELGRLRELAHHLRHCRDCAELDVERCFLGQPLWASCSLSLEPKTSDRSPK